MKYKKFDEFDLSFKNYHLTELSTIQIGTKKQLGNKYSIHCIIDSLLKPYGIFMFGSTTLRASETGQETNIVTRHISIDKNFPIENEPLFSQMYGYKNVRVDIGLQTCHDDYAISFDYNVENKMCTLIKWRYGSKLKAVPFKSLKDLLTKWKRLKDIEKLLV